MALRSRARRVQADQDRRGPLTAPDPTAARRTRNPEETRKRILEAAEEEFARKGFDGARMRDVAQVAGVNHALLHHYFGDKESLFRAVVENAFSEVPTQALEEMRKHGDLEALIPAYVGMLVQFHQSRPSLARLLHLAAMDPSSPVQAAIGEITRYIGAPVQEAIAKALEQGQKDGRVRADLDARRMVSLIMGLSSYVFLEDRFFREFLGGDVRSEEGAKAHLDAAVAFVRSALLVPRGPAEGR